MQTITKHFINGEFVESHGTAVVEVHNPTNNDLIGRVTMGDAVDAERAIASAKAAFPAWSRTTLDERKVWLQKLADALTERLDELKVLCTVEFGGLAAFSGYAMTQARDFFVFAQDTLKLENFEQTVNQAKVTRVPLGVAGLLTPWNGNPWFVCRELLDRAVWRRFQLRLSFPAPTREQKQDWFERFQQTLGEPLAYLPL